MTGRVLFVEDDDQLRRATVQALELADIDVVAFGSARGALDAYDPRHDDVVVTDIRMPRMDGLELHAALQARDPDLPVILVTGHGDVPMAVAALKAGAYDFLTKPFAADHLIATVRRAIEKRTLLRENGRLRALAAAADDESPMIGTSPAIRAVRARIADLAAVEVDVLIEGESGTGKELAALMLHRQSRRRARRFAVEDCAALAADRAEAELFGHAADTMPHTSRSATGSIVAADGGTLLLDNVDALGPSAQQRLLRLLDDRVVVPVGESEPRIVDLRVVATSRHDLATLESRGMVSADLLRRLAAAHVHLPPLRERGDDRLLLFAAFAGEARERFGRDDDGFTDAQLRHVLGHRWPGNVRELRDYAARCIGTERTVQEAADGARPLRDRVDDFERALVEEALRATAGNVSAALPLLQLGRKTLYEKMGRLGIDPNAFRG